MGKPFAHELTLINETISWANSVDLTMLSDFFQKIEGPVYLVGSGGSLSACQFAVDLLNKKGKFAKAITPLELFYLKETLRNSTIIFISSSGRNYDIKFSYKIAIEHEPKEIGIICMKENNPLEELSANHGITTSFNFELPSGKDGFLATNSLIAFYIIFNNSLSNERLKINIDFDSFLEEVQYFLGKINTQCTFTVLYSGWNKSVALDIESKCSEAGLAPSLVADYRNFGHGRHNWFDKQKESAIISLYAEDDSLLANRTLDLLPRSIPRLMLRSRWQSSVGCIELLVKSFIFINELGKKVGIDPGRPGVPQYGRKLYNLPYSSSLPKEEKIKLSLRARASIRRKLDNYNIFSINKKEQELWINAYNNFINNLKKTSFGLILFDYDGTLCSSEERFSGPSQSILDGIIKIIDNGYLIGIATGRGKSVREVFQNLLPRKYWDKILIAYYNGSDCGFLNDNGLPNKELPLHPSLASIEKQLLKEISNYDINLEVRPSQLTVEVNDINRWAFIRKLILQIIGNSGIHDIQILESSHSLDIIPNSVSKLNMISFAQETLKELSLPQQVLCIGDKGQWPGNDFQLLDNKFGLSVDEVSPKFETCWNIASNGKRNISATIEYMNAMNFSDKGIKLNINK